MIVWLVIMFASVADGDIEYSQSGRQCTYEKYEGGDGSVFPISPIPVIEAKVPTTLLADMFGKATDDWNQKMALGPKQWLQFASVAAKGLSKALKTTAPMLAPCLGVLGVGFGFLSRELTKIKPEQIIKEVNKAIGQVVDQTNKRFELFEEVVDEKIRDQMRKTLTDIYKGQHEVWAKCVRLDSKERVDECQEDSARAANRVKYQFVFQELYQNDVNHNLNIKNSDIKAIELQLPILKRFADFHMLVLGALVKTFEGKEDDSPNLMYEFYRDELYSVGNFYIAYMQWAVRRIRKARIEDQPRIVKLTCPEDSHEKSDTTCGFCYGRLSARYFNWIKRKCEFKSTSMRPEYCEITGTLTCSGKYCYISPGIIKNSAYREGLRRYGDYCVKGVQQQANKIAQEYNDKLQNDLDAYWDREINMFIPKMVEVINEVSISDNSDKRAAVPEEEEGQENLTEEQKAFLKRLEEKKKKREDEDKEALKGVTGEMSLQDYLDKVAENYQGLETKEKKRIKLKNVVQGNQKSEE